jgi:predicted transcriptional regulator/DNA-binding XRE family transcriptional regulator
VEVLDRKLFLGAKLRRLRRELGVTQTRMAEDIGVSPSYLNLIERNQRPVTAQVLLRLAEAYDLDLRSFSSDREGAEDASLTEVFADGLFQDLGLSRHEVQEVAENFPGVTQAVLRLYQAYVDRRRLADVGGIDASQAAAALTPSDWVRDFIQAQRNYFLDLDELGEALAAELGADGQDFAAAARERLLARHGIRVQVAPVEMVPATLRRFNYHHKRLFLSELLSASSRSFGIAYQLALLEGASLINALVERAAPPDRPTRTLLKVSLANYLAAAMMMPYEPFHAAAEKSGYDIGLLKARFGVSFEQAVHRLTTLSKPGARGVPFFMLRVDSAGNISKRFANTSFPFSRFGGACPRWNIHLSFRTPGRILTQVIETPDGARYFTLARTVLRAGHRHGAEEADLAIGLGCELKYASKLIYSRGLDLAAPDATEIGPTCRMCERPACPQRAAEPVSRMLMIDDFAKYVSPYPFATG